MHLSLMRWMNLEPIIQSKFLIPFCPAFKCNGKRTVCPDLDRCHTTRREGPQVEDSREEPGSSGTTYLRPLLIEDCFPSHVPATLRKPPASCGHMVFHQLTGPLPSPLRSSSHFLLKSSLNRSFIAWVPRKTMPFIVSFLSQKSLVNIFSQRLFSP